MIPGGYLANASRNAPEEDTPTGTLFIRNYALYCYLTFLIKSNMRNFRRQTELSSLFVRTSTSKVMNHHPLLWSHLACDLVKPIVFVFTYEQTDQNGKQSCSFNSTYPSVVHNVRISICAFHSNSGDRVVRSYIWLIIYNIGPNCTRRQCVQTYMKTTEYNLF